MSDATEAAIISLTQSLTEGSTEAAKYLVETLAKGHYFDGIASIAFAMVIVLGGLWGIFWSKNDYEKCIEKDTKYDGCGNAVLAVGCGIVVLAGLFVATTHLKHILAPDAVAINEILRMFKRY